MERGRRRGDEGDGRGAERRTYIKELRVRTPDKGRGGRIDGERPKGRREGRRWVEERSGVGLT